MTVTLDMLALGMIAPVLPRLIEGFLNGNASTAAKMIGLFGTLFAGMQFFFSPVLGSLSDRFGRRPVVLLSNFGMGLDYVVMALAPTLPWLFLGRIISGLTASSIPTAMAYMADVTPKEKRAAAFGLLNAAFGIGFVLGPAMGGVLGNVNPRLPFWVAAGLSLANGMYGLFVLPESLPKELRNKFSWKRANPVGSLRLFRSVKGLVPLAGVLLMGYISQQSLQQVYVIYADTRFGWTNRTVGLSLAVVGIFQGLYGVFLVKPALAKLGERRAMIFGYIGGICGYFLFGFTKHRTAAVSGDSVAEPDGRRVAIGAVDHVAQRAAKPARRDAGSGELAARDCRTDWAGPVYVGIFEVDWSASPGADGGVAVLSGVGAVDGRVGPDPVCHKT